SSFRPPASSSLAVRWKFEPPKAQISIPHLIRGPSQSGSPPLPGYNKAPAHCLAMADTITWVATIATIIAASMTAANLGSRITGYGYDRRDRRSEEHTSELQSQSNLVCR